MSVRSLDVELAPGATNAPLCTDSTKTAESSRWDKEAIQNWWGPVTLQEWKDQILASIVVCFAQIPASVAFASLANVDPSIGLHAAWIIGLICALFGGRPGMITGSAGALGSVTCNFVTSGGVGVEELFMSVILAGVLIAIAAACNVGRFLSLVPATVMIGFCNGLAIVIGSAQLGWFQDEAGEWLEGAVMAFTLSHCFLAMLITVSIPKVTKQLPASLIAIVIGCIMEEVIFRGSLGTKTITIGEKSRFEQSRAIPKLFFLDDHYDLSNITSFKRIFEQAVILAVVALLESLMTLEVINDLTGTVGQANKQVWALGVANIFAGLFGTMGGTSLIELSVMSVHAGGTMRACSTLVSLGVLAIVLFASPVLNQIPSGTLAGIMVIAVIETAKWSSLPAMLASILPESVLKTDEVEGSNPSRSNRLRTWLLGLRVEKYDAFIIILVTVMTYVTDLAVAVFCGVFFASVRFAWLAQQPVEITTRDDKPGEVKTYVLKGSLFFAAKEKLTAAFTPEMDPQVVQIDFARATVFDFSVLHALHPVLERYSRLNIEVKILNMKDANHLYNLLTFNTVKDGGHQSFMSGTDSTPGGRQSSSAAGRRR